MRLRQYLISAFFHRPVTPNMRVILLAQSYFTTYRVIQLVWPIGHPYQGKHTAQTRYGQMKKNRWLFFLCNIMPNVTN